MSAFGHIAKQNNRSGSEAGGRDGVLRAGCFPVRQTSTPFTQQYWGHLMFFPPLSSQTHTGTPPHQIPTTTPSPFLNSPSPLPKSAPLPSTSSLASAPPPQLPRRRRIGRRLSRNVVGSPREALQQLRNMLPQERGAFVEADGVEDTRVSGEAAKYRERPQWRRRDATSACPSRSTRGERARRC